MTKLLEHVIAIARELKEHDQDELARSILSMMSSGVTPLDDRTRAAIEEGTEQARRGELVPDEEIEALWKQHGL